MDSVTLLSKEVGVSVIFGLFLLERFSLSGVFKLTTSLESTVPERMSTIFVSQKLNMSIKGSTVNKIVFSFVSVRSVLLSALLFRQCFF